MNRIRFPFSFFLVLIAACNFPLTPNAAVQTAGVGRHETATPPAPSTQPLIPQTMVKPGPKPDLTWSGGTLREETGNLLIDYPDFVDPAEARKHADALQKAYDSFRVIFSLGDEELYDGQKAVVEFRTTTAVSMAGHNHLYMGSGIVDGIREGYVNPPDPTFFHEMGHLFETAEEDAGRYYVFHLVGGMNEGLAEYFKCHPQIFKLWETNPRSKEVCDLILKGIGAKGPEWTLEYFESHGTDLYALNWNEHPSGVCGEVLFPQMLARVSEKAGWVVWEKFFSETKPSGGNPSAKEAYLAWAEKKPEDRMRDPLIKQAVAEFVASLSQAAGEDLGPMFRGWGFEL